MLICHLAHGLIALIRTCAALLSQSGNLTLFRWGLAPRLGALPLPPSYLGGGLAPRLGGSPPAPLSLI